MISGKREKYQKTDAIILKVAKQGEINRFFTFISPTIGIESATAFGASKATSRFCSIIQPFTEAKLFLSRSNKSGFFKLDDASDVVDSQLFCQKLIYYYLLNFFTEILLKCYFSSSENKSYYFLLKYSIDILKNEKDISKAFLFFTSKFLILNGYDYTLLHCKKTNKIQKEYFFYPSEGGVFIEEFFTTKYFKINSDECFVWDTFLKKRYNELINVKVDSSLLKKILPIIFYIMEEIFEKKLNSVKYLQEKLKEFL